MDNEFTRRLRALVGKQIYKLRNKRGLTLDQAAEAMGTKKQNLSRVENGKKNFTIDLIARVLVVTNHDPEDFFK